MSSEIGEVFIDEAECGSWVRYVIDAFVIIKAIILILISLCGIRWYLKSKLQSLSVIFVLLGSIAIVALELAYRFSSRYIFHRFLLNSLSQWIVFACFTVMIGFSRKN